MKNKTITFACKAITNTNTFLLFIILEGLFLVSRVAEGMEQDIIYSFQMWLVYCLFTMYYIALGSKAEFESSRGSNPIFNLIFISLYSILLTYMSVKHKVSAWEVIMMVVGNSYCLYFTVRCLRDIGRFVVSIEKNRAVNLGEYLGISLALLLYIFGIPVVHTRIQRVLNR